MNQRHYLLKGTFFLTGAGFATRIAGFFYKIFLSRTIGAKEIGIFQLTTPVYAFCMAFGIGGIQTAVSRFTAEYFARDERSAARRMLFCSLLLSFSLSAVCAAALFICAPAVASRFLLEPACAPLLKVIAFSLPFGAVHACISGYFIGCKNVSVPALSQMLEQLIRISTVLAIFMLTQKEGRPISASAMAVSQITSEAASALYCICVLLCSRKKESRRERFPSCSGQKCQHNSALKKPLSRLAFSSQEHYKKILAVSTPLTLNRMLMCVLQGMEAALLPQQLERFGLGSHDALAVYGTLTGMTLPLIFFPTAVTGAVSTLLLPAVSEARALNHKKQISDTVSAGFQASVLLGSFFMTVFFLFGTCAGSWLFHNELSGLLLQKLAFICPFLYLNTTQNSILHGLGKTTAVFLCNIAGFALRLASVIVLVPRIGIGGYLDSTILSQALISVCSLFLLRRDGYLTVSVPDTILKSAFFCIVSCFAASASAALPGLPAGQNVLRIAVSLCICTAAFFLPAWFLMLPAGVRAALKNRCAGSAKKPARGLR